MDRVLGLSLDKEEEQVIDDIPIEVKELAEKRYQAKLAKDYTLADTLRKELTEKGYSVMDTKDGYTVKKN
jgi:cysteinyl-tRNA synthetase